MRIRLAHNSLYYPAHGGGDKSNRLLLEALAAHGHECRAVSRLEKFGQAEQENLLQALSARGISAKEHDGVVHFSLHGVDVHVLANHPHLRAYFNSQIAAFRPEIILTSTDDPAQLLLESALRSAARVVYLARATIAVPFGPDSAFTSRAKTAQLANVDGIVGVSQYVADYIKRWSGIEAIHVPISLQDPGPYPELGSFDNEFVTMVNPCAIKGISIFLDLAERMPNIPFAAVPTWGTSTEDRSALAVLPNVTLLKAVDRIDELLARTKVLLVPSLWAEARSRIIVEAMLRGVPVLAANVGGIPEAKLGVDYLLPVKPIEKYLPQVDAQMVPIPIVPKQDIRPWQNALERVTADREHYAALSKASRVAALNYTQNHGVELFESYLQELVRSPKKQPLRAEASAGAGAEIETLSAEKRKLLALRLQRKTAENPWLPGIETASSGKLRLFCFPYAGGGVAAFRGWQEALGDTAQVYPLRLPGRETRIGEPAVDDMHLLVQQAYSALERHLDEPFLFFGHSMGAAVAFEMARLLRSLGKQGLVSLLVSAARAPQYRLGHTPPPEPSDSEFLKDIERLEGIPKEVLASRELMKLLLPSLKADARLYRNYSYTPDPPLDVPIHAFGGLADPNISREHIEAWREQTSVAFSLQSFSGSHFFIHTGRVEFLAALSKVLKGG
jgi:surfactin synthase thioesterase subunit/glycosyltransferase involved in cell wall biosynthesis